MCQTSVSFWLSCVWIPARTRPLCHILFLCVGFNLCAWHIRVWRIQWADISIWCIVHNILDTQIFEYCDLCLLVYLYFIEGGSTYLDVYKFCWLAAVYLERIGLASANIVFYTCEMISIFLWEYIYIYIYIFVFMYICIDILIYSNMYLNK